MMFQKEHLSHHLDYSNLLLWRLDPGILSKKFNNAWMSYWDVLIFDDILIRNNIKNTYVDSISYNMEWLLRFQKVSSVLTKQSC